LSEQFSRVQKHIKDVVGDQTQCIWCWACTAGILCWKLTLSGQAHAVAQKTFGTLQLCVDIERSTMRHREYMEQVMNISCSSPCVNLVGRLNINLKIVDWHLPDILNTLAELGNTDSEAAVLCKAVKQFDIIFGIKLLKLVFGYANDVSEYLQIEEGHVSHECIRKSPQAQCHSSRMQNKSYVRAIIAKNSKHLQVLNFL